MSHCYRDNIEYPKVDTDNIDYTLEPPNGGPVGSHANNVYGNPITGGCYKHRPPNHSNPHTALPTLSAGTELTANDLNLIRSRIVKEITNWNKHYGYDVSTGAGSNATSGNEIGKATLGDLAAAVHRVFGKKPANATYKDITSSKANLNQSSGAEISLSEYNRLVTEYNIIRTNCICNTDCACNAVCICNNDCGCNYG